MVIQVEIAIDELRHDQQKFKMIHSPDQYCDANSRDCEFLGLLDSAQVWPLLQQMDDSAAALHGKLKPLKSCFHHICTGGNLCPLPQVVNTLWDKVSRVVTQAKGLDLQSFQRKD